MSYWPPSTFSIGVELRQSGEPGLMKEARLLGEAVVIELARFSRSHLIVKSERAGQYDYIPGGQL